MILIIDHQLSYSSCLLQPQARYSNSIVVAGQEPLTPAALANATPQEQKQMLGERLFPLIAQMQPELAGKITGMLLEIDNTELLHMLESRDSLKAKVSGGDFSSDKNRRK